MNIKKIMEMEEKREDARLKAMAVLQKAEEESRFLTDEEKTAVDKYENEIRSWDESISRSKKMLSYEPEGKQEAREEEPEVKTSASKNEKRFL
jgi:hypothetical protein